ncbi:recombination mediator RecR [Pelistega europaea]|uniref:Recombination protein RecR n=1 Tax=Pelistega europaea TaxID=106147 RepID=A0A7Y4P565_9BURK|nr:recombination mediator RecR [Pelistega europaea]NOL49468.1 recombination protein RecR [Pelistega europaea]
MSILPEPEPLHELIEALTKLPGVGKRTARRMAYHLLQYDRESAQRISQAIDSALTDLKHCKMCNSFTKEDVCAICSSPRRDHSLLCVVETAADLNMIEASHSYHGLYYVLMGKLSPLEGVGGDTLGFERLLKRVFDYPVQEVILANNFTAEGETTAHYLGNVLREQGIKVSRIARGVPSGSELEYVDAGTIAWALTERRSD